MWTTPKPESVSWLPRHDKNGVTNDGQPSVQPPSLDDSDWTRRFEELECIRALKDDWDGQGAEAPSSELVESAFRLAKLLEQQGIDAPCCALPGVNGTVVFEWQSKDKAHIEIEVTGPSQTSGCLIVPGGHAEHWNLQ